MKMFMDGDFISNNGIGIGNRSMLKSLSGKLEIAIFKEKTTNRVKRIIEVIHNLKGCDILLLCSPSRLNVFFIILARIFNIIVFYRAHGFISEDYNIKYNKRKLLWWEKFCFKYSQKVFWVSQKAMDLALSYSDKYKSRFDLIYNSINFHDLNYIINKIKCIRNDNFIISVGGGRKQKNNQSVAKAISLLNKKGYHLTYLVLGSEDDGFEELMQYSCVDYKGLCSYEETLLMMKKSNLFIINSKFDTYSLSLVEAMLCGCYLLISKNVGALETFDNLDNNDIIYNNCDIEELESKIEYLLLHSNNKRLSENFRYDLVDSEIVSRVFLKKKKKEFNEFYGKI